MRDLDSDDFPGVFVWVAEVAGVDAQGRSWDGVTNAPAAAACSSTMSTSARLATSWPRLNWPLCGGQARTAASPKMFSVTIDETGQ
jgi:hypothetical protein